MANDIVVKGKACVFGDYVDTYQILPRDYWGGAKQRTAKIDPEEVGKHVMEGADPSFAAKALAGEYAIIVGGSNFGGGGKSIEDPIYALMGAKIKAVIAESISRYFYRNAINNGVLALVCEGITANVKTGDELEINLMQREIRNLTNGSTLTLAPMAEINLEILKVGGYIPYIKAKRAAQAKG